ncbi:S8 family peptidase [Marinoscillum pacificum]|uniref:S8 family peptidase n=1 Tax=Marinoscillum pacificum TaxID=392723 RepID=UPI002157871C|nr:S8 family peptidase [Marinoscillum pacificum]
MGRNKVLLSCLMLVAMLITSAQDRYMVFFSDKANVGYSIDHPEEFLTSRAIARREKHGIAITEQDLPVDQNYINQVADKGVDVFFSTKWFNGVLAQMTASQATSVGQLSFVDSVVYIAGGTRLLTTPGTYTVAETFLDPESVNSNTEVQLAMLGADDMHEDGFEGQGMMIAVFDSGFPGVNKYKPFEHIFAEDRLVATRDFIANSGNVFQYNTHGASVFSNIASDYLDVIGTAPKASFVLCVTEDVKSEYWIEEYNWLFAAEFADSLGVDVINGSLGYSTFSDKNMDYTYEDMNGQNTLVAKAANIASQKGMIVVVSAGNEGNGSWKYITSPGDAKDILTVGSVTSGYNKSSFSSVGPTADGRIKPDVCAMGTSASIFNASLSTSGETTSARITTGNGTSFSSPQIAGFAAAIWQANPEWTNEEVMESIRMSGTSSLVPDSLYGFGVPKYRLAVNGATIDAVDVFEDKLKVYPNPFSEDKVTLDFGDLKLKGKLEILIKDMEGKSIYHNKIDGQEIPNNLEIAIDPTVNGVYFLILRTKRFNKTVKLVKI